jgi:hypothetical protein
MLRAHRQRKPKVVSTTAALGDHTFRIGALPSAAARDVTAASSGRSVEFPLTDQQMVKIVQSLAVRLDDCYLAVSPAMIQDSIDEAIRCFRGARVRQFLPILIERSAWEALRSAIAPVGR